MQVTIEEVKGRAAIKRFIKFPRLLYKSCDQYVPPIDGDEFKILTESPSLEYCQIKMWIAKEEGGEIVGRVAAIINPTSNELHNEKRVRFGWFDFIDDREVAHQLLKRVAEWGREMGLEELHGPLGFNTWNKQGMLIEGFENLPPANCLYNYCYYPKIMEQLGMEKQIDWIQRKIVANEGVPEKLKEINKKLLERYELRLVEIEELKKDKRLIDSFFRNYNLSFSEIDNFTPLTKKEADAIAKEYFSMLKSELTSIVVDSDNEIAAFAICFPNMSKAFQKADGKLFPFGVFHLLKALKRYDTIDLMLIGATPKWQNKGVSSIYHTQIATNLESGKIKYAISNPQEEHNSASKVWNRYDSELYMKRRCYIAKIENF